MENKKLTKKERARLFLDELEGRLRPALELAKKNGFCAYEVDEILTRWKRKSYCSTIEAINEHGGDIAFRISGENHELHLASIEIERAGDAATEFCADWLWAN